MAGWFISIVFVVCLVVPTSAQTIELKGGKPAATQAPSAGPAAGNASPAAAETAGYRPVVLGQGPDALINRIDTASLVKGGQKDALVMFTCSVATTGKMVVSAIYRASPNSDLLQLELKRRLLDAVFVPGIYDGQLVDAVYYGTVTFVV